MSAKQGKDGRKFGAPGRAAVEVLQAHRITDYRFEKSKHVKLLFTHGGRKLTFWFAGSPRSDDSEAKRVRHRLARLIDEAGT